MPDSIFLCIKHYETAHEMFNYLATTYGDPNPTSIPVKCVSTPAEQLSTGKDEPEGTNEPQDETLAPHVKPDELSSEPPKEVMLKGNSNDEVRSGDEVKAEATVEVVQVKSVEVKGETSGMVSENKAVKRGLGEEATDETDSQDITAKEMVNLKADGGDTEICHTSNRPEHKQLERADNDRLARIIKVKVLPSDGASSHPQTRRMELKGERDSSCVSSTMDQLSSSTDVPQHCVDDPSSNTKDTGGSMDVLQHHTSDPGHHAHKRRACMSARDLPNSLQTPAEHLREGVSTTAAKQHAVGETSCKESDGHAKPKVTAEQCKCEAIEPVPDLTLQMEHSQPKPPMTNYILESPTEQGRVPLEGEYGGNASGYANGQNTSGKDLRDHTNKSAGSESHQHMITKMLEVSRVSGRTVENGRDAPKVQVQPVKAGNNQDSGGSHNTGPHRVEDMSLPMAATQYTYGDTLNRPELCSSAPGGTGLHVKQGCTLAIINETCGCQYTPEEHPKEGIGTTAIEQHAVGSSKVQEVKMLQNECNCAPAIPQESYQGWHMLKSLPDDEAREPEVHGGTETSQTVSGDVKGSTTRLETGPTSAKTAKAQACLLDTESGPREASDKGSM
ncbi:hypothetical protein F5J12DRAFT_785419 [Pisolithus orientalis]|uniref:uncharacterized protein n=1 Tax=Pisolithus orientalis TaxID=936130 RepID=UPI0022248344|nr:uncharacterized protein F5J12DRAFT_785419 [Pisolithus orientalis]KAI5996448.1 hypothetical protein F5J12DRAFT_785419 [Pisolithus orientalis]